MNIKETSKTYKDKKIEKIDINQYFDTNGNFYKLWKNKYSKLEYPIYINKLFEIEYEDFKKLAISEEVSDLEKILDSLFSGDVFLIKNVFSHDFINQLKKISVELAMNTDSTFHKVYNGVPNFRREINNENNQKYSFKMNKHAFYFFPWNDNDLKLFQQINKIWRLTKKISGYYDDAFEKNVPEDGVIDRIQIVKYSFDIGELQLHQDPIQYQKYFISCYMSTRGVDFENGGVYCIDAKKNKNFEIEDSARPGDVSFGLASLMHGVDITNKPKELKDTDEMYHGRWFMGLYTINSDYVINRNTASPVNLKS